MIHKPEGPVMTLSYHTIPARVACSGILTTAVSARSREGRRDQRQHVPSTLGSSCSKDDPPRAASGRLPTDPEKNAIANSTSLKVRCREQKGEAQGQSDRNGSRLRDLRRITPARRRIWRTTPRSERRCWGGKIAKHCTGRRRGQLVDRQRKGRAVANQVTPRASLDLVGAPETSTLNMHLAHFWTRAKDLSGDYK
jgi:hypothetical protein